MKSSTEDFERNQLIQFHIKVPAKLNDAKSDFPQRKQNHENNATL